jgi:hypothetical protein
MQETQEKAREVAGQAQDRAREAARQARGRVRQEVDRRSTQAGGAGQLERERRSLGGR